MKCTKGHKTTIVPFHPNWLCCEICQPKFWEHYQKEKSDRVAKMQLGRKNNKALNLMNSIFEREL